MGIDLKSTQLFRGIGDADLKAMLRCLGAWEKSFRKGDIILAEGQETEAVGVVLSGRAIIEHSDLWGTNSVLSNVATGAVLSAIGIVRLSGDDAIALVECDTFHTHGVPSGGLDLGHGELGREAVLRRQHDQLVAVDDMRLHKFIAVLELDGLDSLLTDVAVSGERGPLDESVPCGEQDELVVGELARVDHAEHLLAVLYVRKDVVDRLALGLPSALWYAV